MRSCSPHPQLPSSSLNITLVINPRMQQSTRRQRDFLLHCCPRAPLALRSILDPEHIIRIQRFPVIGSVAAREPGGGGSLQYWNEASRDGLFWSASSIVTAGRRLHSARAAPLAGIEISSKRQPSLAMCVRGHDVCRKRRHAFFLRPTEECHMYATASLGFEEPAVPSTGFVGLASILDVLA